MGYALFLAQIGERHPSRDKTLSGFGGASVIGVRESYDGNAYRAVYTVRYADVKQVPAVMSEVRSRWASDLDLQLKALLALQQGLIQRGALSWTLQSLGSCDR